MTMRSVLLAALVLTLPAAAAAQLSPSAAWAAHAANQYQVAANITYLLTIPGGKHGNFAPDERTKIFATIREFQAKNGLGENK
jgi:hypothetical protein